MGILEGHCSEHAGIPFHRPLRYMTTCSVLHEPPSVPRPKWFAFFWAETRVHFLNELESLQHALIFQGLYQPIRAENAA
jgi:hypothetical protein